MEANFYETKMKFASSIFNGNSLNDGQKEAFSSVQDGLKYVSSKDIDVNSNQISLSTGLAVPVDELSQCKIAPSGSPLLCIEGGSAGRKIGFTETDVCFVNKLACFSPKQGVSGRFLFYSLLSQPFRHQFNQSMTGMIGGVSISSINNFEISLPNYELQCAVAAYLDNEVGRIDSLISEKQNFITLLKEKHQALISHYVTKGLDPNLKMKDSGVEWIGEVPSHWEITKLRYIGQCQNGINIGGEFFGSGYPFVSYGDVYNNRALPHKVKGLVQSTEKDRVIYSLKPGDVLFTRTSETIDEIGYSSVCYHNIEDAVFAGFLIRFRPKDSAINPTFSEYYFQNKKLRAFFVKEMNLVTRASLSQELLKRMPVALPPENEQREIGEFLAEKNAKFNEVVKATQSSIELLKEHRTALISAAVTGKIDVRGMAINNKDAS